MCGSVAVAYCELQDLVGYGFSYSYIEFNKAMLITNLTWLAETTFSNFTKKIPKVYYK